MAEMTEMEALREENEKLKAEVGRLKATRSAIYKLYIESRTFLSREILTPIL